MKDLWILCLIAASITLTAADVPIFKRAIIFGLDGLGGYWAESTNLPDVSPTLNSLLRNGAWTMRARDTYAPQIVSKPNWAALFLGATVMETTVLSNDWNPDPSDPLIIDFGQGQNYPTIFEYVKLAGKSTLMYTDHDVVFNILQENYVDVDHFEYIEENSAELVNEFETLLASGARPDLMFIHMDNIDEAGHSTVWGSKHYKETIAEVDEILAHALDALDKYGGLEGTLIVIMADHGGHFSTHGLFDFQNVRIPIIFTGYTSSGESILQQELKGYVNLIDVAPTILELLGLEHPWSMLGRSLVSRLFSTPSPRHYGKQSVNPPSSKSWAEGPLCVVKNQHDCPSGFSHGWTQWHTESNDNQDGAGAYSPPLYNFGGNSTFGGLINVSFCCRDFQGNSDWLTSDFCIYRYGGLCPAGFGDGWVRWDTTDLIHNDQISGNVPDNSDFGYKEGSITLRHCCPLDNSKLDANWFTSTPFCFLRKGGSCPADGYWTSSSITWSTTIGSNERSGLAFNPDTPQYSLDKIEMAFCCPSQVVVPYPKL